MSASQLTPAQSSLLESALFTEEEARVYAVLDGASVPPLFDKLQDDAPENACLYRLDPGSEVARVAPYLVLLERGAKFTDWVLRHCAGQHWGIFIMSREGLETVRRQLRKITLVDDDRHQTMLFRFYDPRVLNEYLLMFDDAQLARVFEGVDAYVVEADEAGTRWNRYILAGDGLGCHEFEIAGA